MSAAPQITWTLHSGLRQWDALLCCAVSVRSPRLQSGSQLHNCISEFKDETGRYSSLRGSWDCQMPAHSASTLKFSELTDTSTLTRSWTVRPAHGHDVLLLTARLGSFSTALVFFCFETTWHPKDNSLVKEPHCFLGLYGITEVAVIYLQHN